MPVPVILSNSPVSFVFRRSGGAVIQARLSVWSGAGTPNPKRVLVLHFEDALDDVETFNRTLPQGNYSCVFQVFIREDLNGTFDYEHIVANAPAGADHGDVNTGGTPGQGQVARFEYVLGVQ